MELFVIFAFGGIIAGGIYLIFCFLRRIFNFNIFLQIPLDLISGFFVGLTYCYCCLTFAYGITRFYLLLAFALGFVISLITFKNFVATISDFVYNRIRKLILICKTKIKSRRKANDRRKTNQNC